jgi:hypothetical protein
LSATPDNDLKLLLSFDEAHALTSELPGTAPDKILLDYLAQALNEFRSQPLFALFLSTQSDIEYFAPSYTTARSARIRPQLPDLHAPITETPFDCFETPILPERLMADHPSDIAFMSLFGRPL